MGAMGGSAECFAMSQRGLPAQSARATGASSCAKLSTGPVGNRLLVAIRASALWYSEARFRCDHLRCRAVLMARRSLICMPSYDGSLLA